MSFYASGFQGLLDLIIERDLVSQRAEILMAISLSSKYMLCYRTIRSPDATLSCRHGRLGSRKFLMIWHSETSNAQIQTRWLGGLSKPKQQEVREHPARIQASKKLSDLHALTAKHVSFSTPADGPKNASDQ